MLALAREARGLSQTELAERTNMSRSNISRFEKEGIQMSEAYVKQIIDALGFKTSLYHLNDEIMTSVLYRKRDQVAAKLLTQINANINLYKINIATLLSKIKPEPAKVPFLPVSETVTPGDAAALIRKIWKVGKGVVDNIMEVMESNGIIIVPVDLKTERVDSRSILIENSYPIIFYNSKLLGDRLRFTLAYELGHLVMHSRSKLTSSEGPSRNANLFAAEFLMPKKDIANDLKGEVNVEMLANLKLKWKASMHSLLYRANDLNIITDNQKRYLINQFNLLKIRRREPKELDVPIERPHLLTDLITKYRTKQKMNAQQMAELFHLTEDEFLQRYNFN